MARLWRRGYDANRLRRRRLYRRPGAAAPDRTAEEDIADIARRFGLEAAALARVVERASGR